MSKIIRLTITVCTLLVLTNPLAAELSTPDRIFSAASAPIHRQVYEHNASGMAGSSLVFENIAHLAFLRSWAVEFSTETRRGSDWSPYSDAGIASNGFTNYSAAMRLASYGVMSFGMVGYGVDDIPHRGWELGATTAEEAFNASQLGIALGYAKSVKFIRGFPEFALGAGLRVLRQEVDSASASGTSYVFSAMFPLGEHSAMSLEAGNGTDLSWSDDTIAASGIDPNQSPAYFRYLYSGRIPVSNLGNIKHVLCLTQRKGFPLVIDFGIVATVFSGESNRGLQEVYTTLSVSDFYLEKERDGIKVSGDNRSGSLYMGAGFQFTGIVPEALLRCEIGYRSSPFWDELVWMVGLIN